MGFLGSLIPAVLGGIFSGRSAAKQNRMQMAMAQKQMDFQERMSSTAYQRSAKDLAAAGLNRVLALGSGATTPSGAQAQITNEGQPAINTALAIKRQTAEIENIEATTAKTTAETLNVKEEWNNIGQRWTKFQQEIDNLKAQGNLIRTQNEVQGAVRRIKGHEETIIRSEADLWSTLQELEADEASWVVKLLGPSAMNIVKIFLHGNRRK